ncbi:MAG: hypothetical protein IT456_27510 [Planctomycetes bacterium]|nr:hypothetical protein [Planctomycetota bacterium]
MRIVLGSATWAAVTCFGLSVSAAAQGKTADGFTIDTSPRVTAAMATGHDREPTPGTAPQRPATNKATSGSGLAADASGTLVGIAHGYKAVFGATGIEYTPALGQRAAHDMPLRFELLTAGRGTALQPVALARLAQDGQTVRYERETLVETYEVRADGVKQSFVFTELPAGQGDLLVRGAVATALVAGPVTSEGMAFTLDGVGGVTFGAVLGYDAVGNQVQGAMRYEGGALEFSLPASFVDNAVLPVVIDPLVGTTVTLGLTNDDVWPDVAWDASTATWLAVWRRDLSATNLDIRGQRLDATGAQIGGQINIETNTATLATTPRVANINERDAFVVIWSAGGDVFARGVLSSTAAMTAEVTVAGGSNNQLNPDIGGEATTNGDEAFAVWVDSTSDVVSLRPITYTAGNTLTLGAITAVTSGWPDSDPSISQSGGAPGFWLVTWTRDLSGNFDIRGRIWNRTLGFVTSAFVVESATDDCTQSANDGDGYNWVVAYARTEAGLSTRDVDARSVEMHASGVSLGTVQTIAGDASDDETAPAVGWVGNSAMVAYQDLNGAGNFDAYLRSVDSFRCDSCEGLFLLDVTGTTTEGGVQVGTRFSGGTFTSSEAACVWHSVDGTTSSGDIDWQRFNAADGSATDLAGGCGVGGIAYATCGRSPNPNFTLRLRRAAPSSLGFVVLGFQTLNYSCGGCTLVPDPFTGLITTTSTNTNGDAVQSLAVPSGVAGNQLIVQWLVPGSNCFTNFDLSNAVRITLQ